MKPARCSTHTLKTDFTTKTALDVFPDRKQTMSSKDKPPTNWVEDMFGHDATDVLNACTASPSNSTPLSPMALEGSDLMVYEIAKYVYCHWECVAFNKCRHKRQFMATKQPV